MTACRLQKTVEWAFFLSSQSLAFSHAEINLRMHIGLEEVKQLVSEPEDQELDPPPLPSAWRPTQTPADPICRMDIIVAIDIDGRTLLLCTLLCFQ